MADWESKPQGPSLNQTREIGYVVIKTKNVIALNCTNPAFSAQFTCLNSIVMNFVIVVLMTK